MRLGLRYYLKVVTAVSNQLSSFFNHETKPTLNSFITLVFTLSMMATALLQSYIQHYMHDKMHPISSLVKSHSCSRSIFVILNNYYVASMRVDNLRAPDMWPHSPPWLNSHEFRFLYVHIHIYIHINAYGGMMA